MFITFKMLVVPKWYLSSKMSKFAVWLVPKCQDLCISNHACIGACYYHITIKAACMHSLYLSNHCLPIIIQPNKMDHWIGSVDTIPSAAKKLVEELTRVGGPSSHNKEAEKSRQAIEHLCCVQSTGVQSLPLIFYDSGGKMFCKSCSVVVDLVTK